MFYNDNNYNKDFCRHDHCDDKTSSKKHHKEKFAPYMAGMCPMMHECPMMHPMMYGHEMMHPMMYGHEMMHPMMHTYPMTKPYSAMEGYEYKEPCKSRDGEEQNSGDIGAAGLDNRFFPGAFHRPPFFHRPFFPFFFPFFFPPFFPFFFPPFFHRGDDESNKEEANKY